MANTGRSGLDPQHTERRMVVFPLRIQHKGRASCDKPSSSKPVSHPFDPMILIAKSSIDAIDVAQNLISPLIAGVSHSRSVASIALAWGEFCEKEKNRNRLGSSVNEKGMASASSRGKNRGDVDETFLRKYMDIEFLTSRSFKVKNTITD
ncbi:hypothetical protein F3Y22_tig00110831pilonHSYRG00331 [Hibiscus syriacus]|uniref:Uncharacterized protein n=1 Tax=Hibiscus syriacus TaxID=106335 RepID=A0A6A2ZL60_HIBSY|nr:hypothetical protein F3Y22_tig00110831pilonHSYRG00331 [Hibiscus syriacus]